MTKQEIIDIYKKQSIKIFGFSIQERTLSMTKAWTKVVDAWHSYLDGESRNRIESDYRYRSAYVGSHLNLAYEIVDLVIGQPDDVARNSLSAYHQNLVETFNSLKYIGKCSGGTIDAYGYAISDIEVVLNGKQ